METTTLTIERGSSGRVKIRLKDRSVECGTGAGTEWGMGEGVEQNSECVGRGLERNSKRRRESGTEL